MTGTSPPYEPTVEGLERDSVNRIRRIAPHR